MNLAPPQLDWQPDPPRRRRPPWLVAGVIVVVLCVALMFMSACVQTEACSPSGWHFKTTRVGTNTRFGAVKIPTTQGGTLEISDYDSAQHLAESLEAAAKVVRGR